MMRSLTFGKHGTIVRNGILIGSLPRLGAAVCCIVALFWSCVMDPVAGGSGAGNPSSITATAMYPDGQRPAAYTAVRLRTSGYMADTATGRSRTARGYDLFTDGSGRFAIDSIGDTGVFWIEVNDLAGYSIISKVHIGREGTDTSLDTVTIQRTARIAGRLLSSGAALSRQFVQVSGMERLATTNDSGDYSIDVPGDTFTLRVVSSDGDLPPLELRNVRVKADSTRTLPTMYLYSACTTAECDSAAVRKALDNAGHPEIEVSLVVTSRDSQGRITGLKFDGIAMLKVSQTVSKLAELRFVSAQNCSLTTFPLAFCRAEKLRSLRLRKNNIPSIPNEISWITALDTFDVGENRISSICDEIAFLTNLDYFACDNNLLTVVANEVGMLSAVTTFTVARNALSRLPGEMTGMTALQYLDISYNRFTGIPQVLLRLPALQQVRADSNQICTPPDTVAQWLDQVSPGWNGTQVCQ